MHDVGEFRPLRQTHEEARLVRAFSFVLPIADAQRVSTSAIAVRIAAVFIRYTEWISENIHDTVPATRQAADEGR
ncbi:hypothetical protein [Burkholderia multivorans]|uniref:hypothetical protein n=1 Tax=Burkholderia multivorans TaxID=87883 RepID=UPI000F4F44B1|nr:hypothetical protein [Burkholderia multivorans]